MTKDLFIDKAIESGITMLPYAKLLAEAYDEEIAPFFKYLADDDILITTKQPNPHSLAVCIAYMDERDVEAFNSCTSLVYLIDIKEKSCKFLFQI